LIYNAVRLSQGVGGLAGFVYFTNEMAIVPVRAQTLAEATRWLCLLLELSRHVCVI